MDAAESTAGSAAESSSTVEHAARPEQECATSGAAEGLSDRDQAVLAFEARWWKYPGKKEQAIRELFDMSATRYYQILNRLVSSPEAMAADPMLIKRLRRLRAHRDRSRVARQLGTER